MGILLYGHTRQRFSYRGILLYRDPLCTDALYRDPLSKDPLFRGFLYRRPLVWLTICAFSYIGILLYIVI